MNVARFFVQKWYFCTLTLNFGTLLFCPNELEEAPLFISLCLQHQGTGLLDHRLTVFMCTCY